MPEERNALAELADELERFSAENKGLFARRKHLILHRASRIIAELAKVSTLGPKHIPGDISLYKAYANCRAIAAEEGANE